MTATPSIDMSVWVDEYLGQASPDLLRNMIKMFAEAMMSAEAYWDEIHQHQLAS